MRTYLPLRDFLSDAEKRRFLQLADTGPFHQHRSTITGERSVLEFLRIEFAGLERVSLLKMAPNARQDWHVDGKTIQRPTVIVHPISDNYVPTLTQDGEATGTIVLATDQSHAVFNGDTMRLNLQIIFREPFSECLTNPRAPIWSTLDQLYFEPRDLASIRVKPRKAKLETSPADRH